MIQFLDWQLKYLDILTRSTIFPKFFGAENCTWIEWIIWNKNHRVIWFPEFRITNAHVKEIPSAQNSYLSIPNWFRNSFIFSLCLFFSYLFQFAANRDGLWETGPSISFSRLLFPLQRINWILPDIPFASIAFFISCFHSQYRQ